MKEQCKICAWNWEKCDEHLSCRYCPMNNVEIAGRKTCYCLSIPGELNGNCPYYEPRKESGDEDNTEM